MLELFAELGATVDRAWGAHDYRRDVFPQLTAELLSGDAIRSIRASFDVGHLVELFGTEAGLPQQIDPRGAFGQPPLTLYVDPERRFGVDVYCWMTPDTAIHNHGFSGACTILDGETLHTEYRFDVERRFGTRALLGHLTTAGSSLLRPGDTFAIPSGEGFIHKTTHLSRPSISLVIRTLMDPGVTQYMYFSPCIATRFDREVGMEALRGLRLWRFLRDIDHPRAREVIERLVRHPDLGQVLQTFIAMVTNGQTDDAVVLDVLAELRARADGPGARLDEVLQGQWARQHLFRALSAQVEPRLFVSLLDSYGWRKPAIDLLHAQFPDRDLTEQACTWFTELGSQRRLPVNATAYFIERLRAARGGEQAGDADEIEASRASYALRYSERALAQYVGL